MTTLYNNIIFDIYKLSKNFLYVLRVIKKMIKIEFSILINDKLEEIITMTRNIFLSLQNEISKLVWFHFEQVC